MLHGSLPTPVVLMKLEIKILTGVNKMRYTQCRYLLLKISTQYPSLLRKCHVLLPNFSGMIKNLNLKKLLPCLEAEDCSHFIFKD